METESHATFEQIEALYLGRLGGRNGEQVRAHLRRCGQCDAAYERLAGLDAALYHAGEDLSPASLQRVGARLFDAPPPAPARAARARRRGGGGRLRGGGRRRRRARARRRAPPRSVRPI
ncbi:MAG: hypothetical protein KC933_37915, partial [Myxococcales bacterium]|nr:hypothetical protein [Myxococcales bacterium]